MRSLRARLFLSIGVIFLIIAILSYVIPKFFVRKDIDAVSAQLDRLFYDYHNKVEKLTDAWVTYRILEIAAQLGAAIHTLPDITQKISAQNKSLWELAAAITSYDPKLAFVQITDLSGNTVVISPESGYPYIPLWAHDAEGKLWVKIPVSERIFATVDLGNYTYLLLNTAEGIEKAASLHYTPLDKEPDSFSLYDSQDLIYDALRWRESLLLQQTVLIQELVAHPEGVGIMKVDPTFKRGGVLFSSDIFFTKPVVTGSDLTNEPGVVYRNRGPYVDLAQIIKSIDPQIVIGYSLSTLCQQIAQSIQRPLLLFYKGKLLQGFDATGNTFAVESVKIISNRVIWKNQTYIQDKVEIEGVTISILTPESFLQTIDRLFGALRNKLIEKISLNLLLISLVLLAIALLLLARISKKITEPIALLAQASEEIGKGKYEGLHLPAIENRKDEVATLTHSFEKMVISLQEREKIRGVLNKVVSKEIATQVLTGDIELGGEERTISLLFSDIRGFTPLSEKLSPRHLIGLLNAYMTRMCHIIDDTSGVVDKFVGDEIMALYGAPLNIEQHADKALKAAVQMMRDLHEWNKSRKERIPIKIGIGIHTGVVLAGNMGAENRLNYTVVGANVNLAARLCSAAKPMQILVSEQTYLALSDPQAFPFQKSPPLTLKGIDHPVTAYSLEIQPQE